MAGDAAHVEEHPPPVAVALDPQAEEGVALVGPQAAQQLGDPLALQRRAVVAALVQPMGGEVHGGAHGAHAVAHQLQGELRILGPHRLGQHTLEAQFPDDLVQHQVLADEDGSGDRGDHSTPALGEGGLPVQVVVVVDRIAPIVETTDALAPGPALLRLLVPVGMVLVEVGDTRLLVEDPDDFGLLRCCFHSYRL